MQPYQQQVVTERNELLEKIERLATFLTPETYHGLDQSERTHLVRQLLAMDDYRFVLDQRIAAF